MIFTNDFQWFPTIFESSKNSVVILLYYLLERATVGTISYFITAKYFLKMRFTLQNYQSLFPNKIFSGLVRCMMYFVSQFFETTKKHLLH